MGGRDGGFVTGHTDHQVYVLEEGERKWVPDSPVVGSAWEGAKHAS